MNPKILVKHSMMYIADFIQRHPVAIIFASLSGIGISLTTVEPYIQITALALAAVASALTAYLKYEQIKTERLERTYEKERHSDAAETLREGRDDFNDEQQSAIDELTSPE